MNAEEKRALVEQAEAWFNEGVDHYEADQLALAAQCWRSALEAYRRLVAAGHDQYLGDMATTEMNLGVALSDQGDLSGAMRAYEDASKQYRSRMEMGGNPDQRCIANLKLNHGAALLELGNPSAAILVLECALAIYCSQNNAGNVQNLADAAMTEMNLGSALLLLDFDNLQGAIHAFERAQATYRNQSNAGSVQYLADAAMAEMNLGIALTIHGDRLGAICTDEAALATCCRLIYDEGAMQHLDLLHSALSTNCHHALEQLSSLFDESEGRQPNMDLMRQHVLDNLDRRTKPLLNRYPTIYSKHLIRVFKSILVKLQRWKRTLHMYYQHIFQQLRLHLIDSSLVQQRVLTILDHLDHQTRLILEHVANTDKKRFKIFKSVLGSLQYWELEEDRWPQAIPAITEAARALALAALSAAHRLLIEGNPVFVVQRYESDLAPSLNQLLALMARQGWVQHAACWYLSTQGLRAQRQALLQAHGTDPEIAQLLDLYQQLDNLLHQMLGDKGAETGFRDSDTGVGRAQGVALAPQRRAYLQAQYDAVLQQQFQPLKARLQAQGKYPETPPLDLEMARACLARQAVPTQILMLIPLGEGEARELLLVRVGLEARDDALLRVPLAASLAKLSTDWQALRQHAFSQARATRGGVAGWRDLSLSALPTSESAESQTPSAEAADELLNQCLDFPNLLLPHLQAMAAAGIQCVHILPAGDAHLAPWAATLDQAIPGLGVRQFPSAGGWWRAMAGQDAADSQPPASTASTNSSAAPTAWASLAYDAAASSHQLFWVAPEAQAIQAIWQAGRVQPLDPKAPHWPAPSQGETPPVAALACIGHGQAPEGNLALAGLVLPKTDTPGDWGVFTAMQLHQIRHAERLVMSCCVLGRIEDAQGEPLGMTALAFAFKTRFAVGAMLPIPDFAGSLFFMALHHAWASAEATAHQTGTPMDWAAVFHATRRSIMQGHWPAGFGDWLNTAWLPLIYTMGKEDGAINKQRLIWLCRQDQDDNEAAFVAALAKAPNQEVRWVAAVTGGLG